MCDPVSSEAAGESERMIDVREAFESPEMDEVVQAIEALRRKYSVPAAYDRDHEWPVAIACVGRFRATVVLNIILSDEQYYPGYKEVLTAAFGGWLMVPRARVAREALMTHAAVAFMEKAVALVGNEDPLTLRQDLMARYVLIGPEFLTEVYDCLGGYQAFADVPSFDELWDGFESIEKPILTVARAIAYLHHAIDRFIQERKKFSPSLNKAVTMFDELKRQMGSDVFKKQYVSRSMLHQRWSGNKQTLALIYAASTIKINRKSLLRLILDGFLSYDDHGPYLQMWVGRAKYVSEHIFARMDDSALRMKTQRLLGDVAAVPFQPPKLDPTEVDCFEKSFRNYISH